MVVVLQKFLVHTNHCFFSHGEMRAAIVYGETSLVNSCKEFVERLVSSNIKLPSRSHRSIGLKQVCWIKALASGTNIQMSAMCS